VLWLFVLEKGCLGADAIVDVAFMDDTCENESKVTNDNTRAELQLVKHSFDGRDGTTKFLQQ